MKPKHHVNMGNCLLLCILKPRPRKTCPGGQVRRSKKHCDVPKEALRARMNSLVACLAVNDPKVRTFATMYRVTELGKHFVEEKASNVAAFRGPVQIATLHFSRLSESELVDQARRRFGGECFPLDPHEWVQQRTVEKKKVLC